MPTPTASRGRPPAASRDLLQEAALELFLEQGYAGTTVEQVTRRAGVSRGTFFNYFEAKGDVVWVELDAAVAALDRLLAEHTASREPIEALRQAVLEVGENHDASRVPFALTQRDIIGSAPDLRASAMERFAHATGIICRFLLDCDETDARARAIAYATVGAAVAAALAWASAGAARGTLRPHLERAVSPVLDGFAAAS